MTLELANRAICIPAGIARDVFVLVGNFTFLADFVIVDCESDPRVPLILGRPFLQIARALIDVHGEEMILHDVKDDIFDPKGGNVLIEKVINVDSTKDLPPSHNVNPLSGSTTSSSSPNHLLEEFTDEPALITFPLGNYDLPFDIGSDLKKIEYFLNNDPIKEMDPQKMETRVGQRPFPSNTIANSKGELKAIIARSGIVLDGPSIPIHPPFINLEEDERVEETLTDHDLAEYTLMVPPPLVQKPKPPS
nr:reverse transcriptase domain-containing protein [Tanacetum cinerariifolium]